MNIKRWLKNKRIGVLYGGWSEERDISIVTGKAVLNALKDSGYNAVGIDVNRDIDVQLKKRRIDFAFVALHGPFGEDGTIQGLLEMIGIPYSGSGVLGSALGINKIHSKRIFDSAELPTPRWQAVQKNKYYLPDIRKIKYPVVVKPATQGSAIGISIVYNRRELSYALKCAFKLDNEALIEEYIKGTEITVSILGNKTLPVIEIVPAHNFYDFHSKYKPGQSDHIIPPRLPKAVIRRSQDLALKAFKVLNCSVFGRVDLIVDKRFKPWILEINTIPGMTPTSLLPDAARAVGISFNELVLKIIEYSIVGSAG